MIERGKSASVLMLLSLIFSVAPAYAGHDHGGTGGMGGMEHGDVHAQSHGAVDEEAVKEGAALLDNCAREIVRLERHIGRMQAEFAGKPAVPSVREELKKLAEKLKEANEIARSLQLF